MTQSIRIVGVLVMMFAISCTRPDVVVRPGSHFTKDSSITLTVGQDYAIFKPELEKELVRHGFNVISDSVAQIISQEKKSSDLKTAGVASADGQIEKAAAKAQGDELTEKSTSTFMKSEYVGKIDYIYDTLNRTLNKVNFTIIEIKTGTIVVSISYTSDALFSNNIRIAQAIVNELETAIGGSR